MIKKIVCFGIWIAVISNILYANSTKLALIEEEEVSFIKKLNRIKKDTEKNRIKETRSVSYPKTLFIPDEYLSLKRIPKSENDNNTSSTEELKYTPQQYLSLKQIIYPMPDKYAYMYLKMKTLENPASQTVKVYINKRQQWMSIYLDNEKVYEWSISTARRGYWTPKGIFRPYSLERMHYSRKYHNSPMPYSVFFKGGYAIHGTYSISHLGRPASHGCVRVHPRNAKKLYSLIRRHGKKNTKIVIY